MKISNTVNFKIANWRIDDDGLLRVSACILKEGIFQYQDDDIPPELRHLGRPINEYVPAGEFTEDAIHTLEGKPIVVDEHEWRTSDNALKDGLTVGSVAGTPAIGDSPDGNKGIICDFMIMDKGAIQSVVEGKLVEVSAAYESDLSIQEGKWGDESFDAQQTNLRFNHVLLLPTGRGRCGSAVRIINQQEEEHMAFTIKRKIGNAVRTLSFTNEADAKLAEEALDEEQTFNAEALAESMKAKGDLTSQITELQAQLAEHDKNLTAAKEEIERLLSPEAQQSAAEEIVEQSEDEEDILNADESMEGVSEEESTQVLNSIRAGKTLSLRRKNMVTELFKRKGVTIPGVWNETAYDAAFETLVTNAKHRIVNGAKQKVLNGTLDGHVQNASTEDAKSRMLRPMKAFNKGGANE